MNLNGLTAPLKTGQDTLTVIYPRFKTQKPPTVTVLSDGRAVKIEHETGTNYVFLYQEAFTFQEGDLHFEGKCGLVNIRGTKVAVEWGDGDKLTYHGASAKGNQQQ